MKSLIKTIAEMTAKGNEILIIEMAHSNSQLITYTGAAIISAACYNAASEALKKRGWKKTAKTIDALNCIGTVVSGARIGVALGMRLSRKKESETSNVA